jgi:hypothetical protein
MITIGPWWLYDTFICFFAFLILLAGIRNGLFVGLYFLLFSAFIYLMLTFIPQLISNAIAPFVVGLLNRLATQFHITDALNGLFDAINSTLKSIMDNFGIPFPALSLTGFITDTATALVALMLYLIIFAAMATLLSLLMLIIYAAIKTKLRAAKINRYVSSLFGGVFGAGIAMFYASTTSIFFAFPILDYSSQKLGPTDFLTDSTPADIMGKIMSKGNQYTKYSLSGKTAGIIPMGKITISYSASCSYKYVLTPLLAGMTSFTSGGVDGVVDKVSSVFGEYADTILAGYATDNIFELPVKQCIQVLPNESQNIVRMLSEFIMTSKALKSLTSMATDGQRPGGQAYILYEQMEKFISDNYGPLSNYRFDQKGFVNFWNSIPQDQNQFLLSVEALEDNGENVEVIKKIFSDPNATYRFLRNVYQVNMRLTTSSSAPFLPSLFTSLYFMQGLEAAPSGIIEAKLGETYDESGTRFDTSFGLKDYMSYVDEE